MSYNSLFGLGTHTQDADLNVWTPLGNRGGQEIANGLSTLVPTSITVDDSDKPADWVDGVSVFNGTSSQFGTTDWGTYDTSIGYTYLVWVKPNSASEDGYVWSSAENSTQNGQGIYLNGGSSKTVLTSGTTVGTAYSNGTAPAANWQHIAFTQESYSGTGQATGYVDAVQVSAPAVPTATPSNAGTGHWRVGNRASGSSSGTYFAGRICEYVRFTRVLSPTEIAEVYNGPEPINTALPTLTIDSSTWTGTVGTWDDQNNGALTYTWELRQADDDAMVENGVGSSPGGSGSYSHPAGYYLAVTASNDGGSDLEATSYLGTLGDGLLCWYDATLDTTDSFKDLSDTGNDGTASGPGVTYVADTDAGGERAFNFDGVDWVDTGSSFYTGDEKFTYCTWAKLGVDGIIAHMFGHRRTSPNQGVMVRVRGDLAQELQALLQGYTTEENGTLSVADGWVFVAYSSRGSSAHSLWLNDVRVLWNSTIADPLRNLFWGARNDFGGSNLPWQGRLDGFRVYDRELSVSEISQLYLAGRGYDHEADVPADPPATPSVIFHPLAQG